MSRLLPALLLALGLHLLLFRVMLPIREVRPPMFSGRSQVTVSLARPEPSVTETVEREGISPPSQSGQARGEGAATEAIPQASTPAATASATAVKSERQKLPSASDRADHFPRAGKPPADEGSPEARTAGGFAAASDSREPGRPALSEAVPLTAANRPPEYPTLARKRGWEGKVLLAVEVAADGTVGAAWVQSGSGHGLLDETALRAVRAWHFQPGTRDGEPVAMQVIVPVHFFLKDDP